MRPVVGLEVHVQLATESKLFCACPVRFGAPANTLVCPTCLGHPGALPTTNAAAVRLAVRLGLALGCDIDPASRFARKHYFYPDLPKGYQISQYRRPIASEGSFDGISIERAHLEEDAAKLVHEGGDGRIGDAESSRVDFNRGGTPLMEIVTRPEFDSSARVGRWLRLLVATIAETGVGDGIMARGSVRVDVNVSIAAADGTLGTKTELKNMNSVSAVERAIDAEVARQRSSLSDGEPIRQATMRFDPRSGRTSVMRLKEGAAEYRYLESDPDLSPLLVDARVLEEERGRIGELPPSRYARFSEAGLSDVDALRVARERPLADRLDALERAGVPLSRAILWLEHPAPVRHLAEIDPVVASRRMSRREAERLLAETPDDESPLSRWRPVEHDIDALVDEAIRARPVDAEEVRAGNARAVAPIVGEVMRSARGLDGAVVRATILERLGEA